MSAHKSVFPCFILLLTLLICLPACSGPGAPPAVVKGPELPIQYPDSPRGDHVDRYHGMEVADPYQWLENLDGRETAIWVGAQNAASEPFLDALPKREAIKERLTEVWNYERFTPPIREGSRYFYERNDGLQDQDVLYVTESLDGKARVLIDPNTFSEDRTSSLGQFEVSPNAQLIAYSISEGGSDWRAWHVREVDTGKDRDDRLDAIKFTSLSWSPDSAGFYYSHYPRDENGKGDGSRQVSVYYHRIGTPQSEDALIYAVDDHPTRNPYGTLTDDGRYLLITLFDGYASNGLYYMRPDRPDAGVVRLLDEWDALYQFLGNEGDVFYLSTNRDAPRSKVVAIDLRNPAPANWRTVVPESAEPLDQASFVGGKIIAQHLKDASSSVKVYGTDGSLVQDVALPGVGSVRGFEGDADEYETFYSYTSFTTPGRIYRYDLTAGSSTLFRESKVAADLDQYETRQIFYESKDGTRIPMFIVHRKGMQLDGGNPTLLYGYGGFNISLTPAFRSSRLVWVEQGGVMAIPNLRGGGEYGEEWHLAGTKANKQNVFDDFIAAAEWLIEEGYTAPGKLAIQGGSNGGLLVAAVMTQRPDLFGAALPAVGVLDMLRYQTASANARQWSSDYGLSENEEDFKALYAYSPYHNIKPGTCYPPTLITTADHDDRVVPWHSFKFAAALQNAQGCPNPVLIRIETRAGHGAGKPTWMRIEEIANQWAFLDWALQGDR